MHPTAGAGVFALCVLAHDDPVEVRGRTPRSGLVTPGSSRAGRTFAY